MSTLWLSIWGGVSVEAPLLTPSPEVQIGSTQGSLSTLSVYIYVYLLDHVYILYQSFIDSSRIHIISMYRVYYLESAH